MKLVLRLFPVITPKSALVMTASLIAVSAVVLTVGRLEADASASRDAELQLMQLRLDLVQMRDVPWDAGDNPRDARGELQDVQRGIESSLAALRRDPGLPDYPKIMRPFRRTTAALWQLFDAVKHGKSDEANELSGVAAEEMYAVDGQLERAAKRYRAHSAHVLTQARAESVAMVLLLFAAFAWFYARATRGRSVAEKLTAEIRRLLAASQEEALTDALTLLGNRRALLTDLETARPKVKGEQVVLTLFDLDGFKQYNDNFGHAAGDTLLARLGGRLATTMSGLGTAYRIGGDEFCMVASVDQTAAGAISGLAAAALSDSGEGFAIGCSYGIALLPGDTTRPDAALLLADQRMYEQKRSGRIAPSRQSADVLLKLLEERSNELGQHTSEVSALAELTAARLGLPADERQRIRLAAELHDVGKAAIPDAILNKPGKLDENEWAFIRRHPGIGERIVRAAPSLALAADLVRWHHEWYNGAGYPDGLAGDEIPIGARVIAVCDAFDAMINDRPYRRRKAVEEAVAELMRCAGTQFDRTVVDAFITAYANRTVSGTAAA